MDNIDIQPTTTLEIICNTAPKVGDIVSDFVGNKYRVTKDLGHSQLAGWWRIEGKLVQQANTRT